MPETSEEQLIAMRADIQALKLIVNEALSITLSHESNPDLAVSLARQDLLGILSVVETNFGKISTIQKQFCESVRSSVSAQLDQIEKRVSTLTQNRMPH